jgi:hypothetical protein
MVRARLLRAFRPMSARGTASGQWLHCGRLARQTGPIHWLVLVTPLALTGRGGLLGLGLGRLRVPGLPLLGLAPLRLFLVRIRMRRPMLSLLRVRLQKTNTHWHIRPNCGTIRCVEGIDLGMNPVKTQAIALTRSVQQR